MGKEVLLDQAWVDRSEEARVIRPRQVWVGKHSLIRPKLIWVRKRWSPPPSPRSELLCNEID